VGIRRTIFEAILPHQDLSFDQVQFNRILGHNRILVENFFERWKMLFRIIRDKFRGSRSLLKLIVPGTISFANYYIKNIHFAKNQHEDFKWGMEVTRSPMIIARLVDSGRASWYENSTKTMDHIYGRIHGPIITSSCEHAPEQRHGQFPSWWCCRSPEGLKDGVQFALPPKGVNTVEMLGEQHHRQSEALYDVVIEQINHWLEVKCEPN
jgi:hypothetical protein